jgi:predicted MFS family arabinose efflux permease
MAGGLVCGLAVLGGSFWLFSLGMALLGFAGAFVQQYRFAASDYGSPGERARAVSLVLSGGVAAAVIGPQTVIYTRNLFDPIPFAGSFFAIIVVAGLAAVTLYGGLVGAGQRPPPERQVRAGGRPLGEIARQPRFIIAVICAIGSYALMSLMMTAAPLAMVGCGLGEDNAALGIQWHALAMFLPSFFTGTLINRYGAEAIIAAGLLLLAGCAAAAVSGLALANFWIALVLLGVGWNFGFIGATTMLLGTYRPEETGKVQGLNDALVFGSVAVASFSSGHLYATVGWHVINWVSLPVIAICFAALAAAVALKRRQAA